MRMSNIPIVPASFFGMVLGLAGLGGAWRAAHLAWGLPAFVGELVMLAAALVWLGVATLYGLKWLVAREVALTEAAHPVQCCFIGLGGVATMLVAGGLIPYSYGLAVALYVVGAAFTAGFAVWRTGGLWMGERDPSHTTPVLYLPTVAGSFVAATVGAALGLPDLGQFYPITASKMTRHQLGASLYAPLRVALFETGSGEAVFEYDRPSSQFGQFGDAHVREVGFYLDRELEAVLLKAAG